MTSPNELKCMASAPTRIDLAGGTLDIWPIPPILQHKSELWNEPIETINVAINLKAKTQVTLKKSEKVKFIFADNMNNSRENFEDLNTNSAVNFPIHRAVARCYQSRFSEMGFNHLEIQSDAQAPKGSGLGGSSALIVSMIGCFERLLGNNTPELAKICGIALNLEAGILGNLAGCQDHYASAFGGIQSVQHSSSGTQSSQIKCDGNELLSRIVLAHSGQQHFSAFNNWLILEKVLAGAKEKIDQLAEIARISHALVRPLEEGDWNFVAKLMSEEWEIRRELAPGISTEVLDRLYTIGREAGAAGGKVCGAGGGGVLVLLVKNPSDIGQVCKAVADAGGILLPAQFSRSGLEIECK